jgi:hypothetical protein
VRLEEIAAILRRQARCPAARAAAELVHVLVVVAVVIVGGGAVCVGDCWPGGGAAHGWTRPAVCPDLCPGEGGAGRPPQERQAPELTATGPKPPSSLHLHFHGVTAEDVAAIIERHRQDG